MFDFMRGVSPISLSGEYGQITKGEGDHEDCAGASGHSVISSLNGALPPGQGTKLPQGC